MNDEWRDSPLKRLVCTVPDFIHGVVLLLFSLFLFRIAWELLRSLL